jgi:hypothetical protein
MDVRCTKRLNTKTALKHAATDAKMLIGESAVTAAPFFERVRDDHPNPWGPQQGNRVILWGKA